MGFNNVNVNVSGSQSIIKALQNYNTVILKPNIVDNRNVLTQEMMSERHTKYIIRWNYSLEGATINVPEDCIIEFAGGTIDNGTIVGNNTMLIYSKPIDEVCLVERQGTFIYNTTVADEEDITSESGQLKFKDRPNTDGMGKVILRKNIVSGVNTLTQSMINQANTIYVIQYDFTLSGNITIPENCVLEFDGGSLSGAYILTGNNSRFTGTMNGVFGNVSFAGSFNCPEVDTDWFRDLSAVNAIRIIQPLINNSNKKSIYLRDKGYNYILDLSSVVTGLHLYSNTKVFSNATFIVNTNSRNDYRVFSIVGRENIAIDGGKFVGDIDTHGDSGGTSEYCHGILVYDSTNISIKNVEVCNFPGDGISLGAYENDGCKRCQIENVYIHHCGREGITMGCCSNTIVKNADIEYIYMRPHISFNGPGSAIDIEPNENEAADAIVIENVNIKKCGSGISIYGRDSDNNRVGKVLLRNVNIQNILGTDVYQYYGIAIFSQCDYLNAENVYIEQAEQGLGNASIIDLQYTTSYFNNLYIKCDIITGSLAVRSTDENKKCTIVNSTIKVQKTILTPIEGNYYIYNSLLEGELLNNWQDISRSSEIFIRDSIIKSQIVAGFPSVFTALNCRLIYTGDDSLSFVYIDQQNHIKKLDIKKCIFSREANMSGDKAYITISKVGSGILEVSDNIFDFDTTFYTVGRGIIYNANTNNKNIFGYNNIFINDAEIDDNRKLWNQGSNAEILEYMQPLYDVGQRTPNQYCIGIQQFRNGQPVWWDGTQWVDATGTPV